MLWLCANVVIEYDRRRPGLSNAPVDMEYNNNKTEESTAIALNIGPISIHKRTIVLVVAFLHKKKEKKRN